MKRYKSPEVTIVEVVTERVLDILSGVDDTVDFDTDPKDESGNTPTTDEALGKYQEYNLWEEEEE